MSGIVGQNVGRPSGLVKAVEAGGGSWVKIKALTASSSATLSFVDGTDDVVLDSTYPIYCFHYINLHPSTDGALLKFQGNVAGGSGYDETITSTNWVTYLNEAADDGAVYYATGQDKAQGTAFQDLTGASNTGSDNDQGVSGNLYLWGPSNTTFVTLFSGTSATSSSDNYTVRCHIGGYFNLTGAVDEIQFKFGSGNIDSGIIKLFGIKDS